MKTGLVGQSVAIPPVYRLERARAIQVRTFIPGSHPGRRGATAPKRDEGGP